MLEPTPVRLAHQGVLLIAGTGAFAVAIALAILVKFESDEPIAPIASFLYSLLSGGLLALAWIASAAGYGHLLTRWLLKPASRGSLDAPSLLHLRHQHRWLQLPLGVAALLTLAHAAGVFGFLSGETGRFVGIALLLVGHGLLTRQIVEQIARSPRIPRVPLFALLAVPSAGILLLTSAVPPGVLWPSEFGGFDAMSYHLQLAAEWSAAGSRSWPVDHNVYSYLPSYVEVAFQHLAVIATAGQQPAMVLREGLATFASQYLHAFITIAAAISVGRLAYTLGLRYGLEGKALSVTAGCAFAATLTLPWAIVVGSLAYNEMFVVLLCAAGCNVAIERDVSFARRALVAGILGGAACACKPTALFLCGPTMALMLFFLGGMPRGKALLTAIALGVLGGTLTFAPPLLRNFAANGNPVFPAATSIFGNGHWTQTQVDRFAKAHGRDGTIGEQLSRLVDTPQLIRIEGEARRIEPRGVFHTQWGFYFPAGLAAMLALLTIRSWHITGFCLLAGTIVAIGWWAGFSHGQSRFLLPLIINLAVALGLVAGLAMKLAMGKRPDASAVASAASGKGSLVLGLATVVICGLVILQASAVLLGPLLGSRREDVGFLLVRGTDYRSGLNLPLLLASLTKADRRDILEGRPVEAVINLEFGRNAKVLLVGDATPMHYATPIMYNTTWDRSILGDAIEKDPSSPLAWAATLRAQGITHVLINGSEMARYWQSYGYDARVTPDRLANFMTALGDPVYVFERSGQVLLRIDNAPAPSPTPAGTRP
jgi:hypothetical protein